MIYITKGEDISTPVEKGLIEEMFSVKAGQVNSIPFPTRHHRDDPGDPLDDRPSAIQLIGVLKMRKPSNFDLSSIQSVKRAAASEGGASSGGYLLSSLALDPHSLIICSTAPIILTHTIDDHRTFNVFLPADAIPSYKGESFDIEYVVVEKRLSDGHLEMMMVVVKAGMSLNESQCRVLYSQDCPAVICDPQQVTISDLQQKLRNDEPINESVLKVLSEYKSFPKLQTSPQTLQYSIKDNQQVEVAIIKVILERSTIVSITVIPRTAASKLCIELSRVEAIEDLFSASDSTAVKQRLIYRRQYDGIDFAAQVAAEHLPEMCIIDAPIFKIYINMQLFIDDAFSCAIYIR